MPPSAPTNRLGTEGTEEITRSYLSSHSSMSHLPRSTERKRRSRVNIVDPKEKDAKLLNSSHPSHPISTSAFTRKTSLQPTRKKVLEQNRPAKIKLNPSRTRSLPRRRPIPPPSLTSTGSQAQIRRRAVSISDCLTALKDRQESERDDGPRSIASSCDSRGDMPSLMSYGQASAFSRQSCSSAGSGFSLSSESVDISLDSSEPPTSVLSSATKSLSASYDADDGYSRNSRTSSSYSNKRSTPAAAHPPPPPALSDASPIQIVRVKRPNNGSKQPPQQRSLLKTSAKNYQPDVLPRREMRWKTTEDTSPPSSFNANANAVQHYPFGPRRASTTTSSTGNSNSDQKRQAAGTTMMIRPPQRSNSLTKPISTTRKEASSS
jgi:hypothetical protein